MCCGLRKCLGSSGYGTAYLLSGEAHDLLRLTERSSALGATGRVDRLAGYEGLRSRLDATNFDTYRWRCLDLELLLRAGALRTRFFDATNIPASDLLSVRLVLVGG